MRTHAKCLLVCNRGKAADTFAVRLNREIARRGVAAEVEAVAPEEVKAHARDYQLLLLAPRTSCRVERAPLLVLTAADYDRMNARRAADTMLQALNL